MTRIVADAALVLTAAGVICVVWAAVWTATWRPGLHMALDLWIAAGLLRLAADPGLADVLAAAAVVALRQLIMAGLRADRRVLTDGG